MRYYSTVQSVHTRYDDQYFFLGLESQLGPVVAAISKNKSIKKLCLGRNLINIKSKHVYHVMEAVVQMFQVSSSVFVYHIAS